MRNEYGAGDDYVGFIIIETVLNARGWLNPLESVTTEKGMRLGTALEHSSLRGQEGKDQPRRLRRRNC